jgi:hypothetical protein
MLHVGGVQDAITVAPPPRVDPLALPELVTVTEPDCEELQVKGIPATLVTMLMTFPTVSVTVGTIVFEVALEPVTSNAIDWTAHVVKLTGRLVAVPMVANTGVTPGVFAVAST